MISSIFVDRPGGGVLCMGSKASRKDVIEGRRDDEQVGESMLFGDKGFLSPGESEGILIV